jgi:uncharacterized membrane protein YfcA
MELTWGLFVAVIALAVACQYVAVALGIGYGTALTPLLIIIGFAPLQIVPAVLLSQLAGGIVGGLAHHRAGNIHLDFRKDDELIKQRLRGLGYLPRSIDAKVVLALVAIGVIGVLVGVFTAVQISPFALEVYIGVLVLLIGIIVLLQRGRKSSFSWKSIFAVGIIGAFNKGMTGGGYVPLVTGGQIIGGREAKSSVGSTTVSIAVLCAVGFLGYLLAEGVDIDWKLAGAACIGAVMIAPLAALTTKRIKTDKLKIVIGLATILLGTLTLVKVFVL